MNWWCSSTRETWDWTPQPYLGSLLIIGALLATAAWWCQRGRLSDPIESARRDLDARASDPTTLHSVPGSPRGRAVAFVLGIIGLWFVIDWPLAALGAGYLATAQMARQVLMVMAVAPLLLFACPPAFAVRVVGWGRGLRVLRTLARPIVAVPVAAATLVTVMAPAVADWLVVTPFGAFVMDGAWVLAGFVLWMPVQCPHPGVRRLEGATVIAYLVLQSIIPVFPGFFLTWADFPLYQTYELAPRAIEGFGPVEDQQTAAVVLQVGGMILLWLQIGYRFLSWGHAQMDHGNASRRKAMPGTPPVTP